MHPGRRSLLLLVIAAAAALCLAPAGTLAATFHYKIQVGHPSGRLDVAYYPTDTITLHPSWTTTRAEQEAGVRLFAEVAKGQASLGGFGEGSDSIHLELGAVPGSYSGSGREYDVQVSARYPGRVVVRFGICAGRGACSDSTAEIPLTFTGQYLNWRVALRAAPTYSDPKVRDELAATTITAQGAATTDAPEGQSGDLTGGVAELAWRDDYLPPLPDLGRTLGFRIDEEDRLLANHGIAPALGHHARGLELVLYATVASSEDHSCPAGSRGVLDIFQGSRGAPDGVITDFCDQTRVYKNDPHEGDRVVVSIRHVEQNPNTTFP